MAPGIPFDAARHGRIEQQADGSIIVAYERQLSHSIEKVWRALTDPEELAGWFPGIRFECRKGASFSLWFGGECEGPAHVEGTVVEFDPPLLLQLGTMRYELTATDSGCSLRFTDVLHFDATRTPQHHALLVLPGWENYVSNLAAYLAGDEVDHNKVETDYRDIDVPGWQLLKKVDA